MTMRPRGLPTVLAALALALMFGCEARVDVGQNWNYTPTLRIDATMTVLDNAGNPLEGATVRLYRKVGDGAVYVTSEVTDANGQATFLQPEPGEYLVSASKDGYVGNSSFMIVGTGSVIASDLKLTPVTQLRDIAQATLPSTGGTVSTQPMGDIPQSSVTVGADVLPDGGEVTIATLSGQQIPVVPPSQVAMSAVLVSVSGELNGKAEVDLGLPLNVPAWEGLEVPVYTFDEGTSQWVQIATGTIRNGQVVAELDGLGTVSALASFFPRRTTVTPEIVVQSRQLGPGDGATVEVTWIPLLSFPDGTNYSDKTQNWIRGVLEQILGYKFGEPVTTKLSRDPNQVQTLVIRQHTDRYTITVSIGGGKPARGAKLLDASTDLFGDVSSDEPEVTNNEHSSGRASGG